MGWLEDQEIRTKKAEDKAKESNQEYLGRKSSFATSRGPNSLAIMGEVTGENKMPEVEPERSWVKDWDEMALNLDDFQMYLTQHMKSMSKFDKFVGIGYDTRRRYYLGTLAKFRPSIIKTVGLEYLYE
jgi:hypothetical protein